MDKEVSLGKTKRWKAASRLIIAGGGFGAGLMISVVLGFGVWNWYRNRPIAWDQTALTATEATLNDDSPVQPAAEGEFGKFLRADGWDLRAWEPRIKIRFDIQNNTKRDITLSKGAVIMEREAGTGTLTSVPGSRLSETYFIPAMQKVRVVLALGTSCAASETSAACFKRSYTRNAGFVVFHDASRIRVDVPKPQHGE